MPIHNVEIADKFNTLANLLEIEGANPLRIRAYRNAARIISGMSKNISDLVAENADLTELPGIGKDLAEKIKIIVPTGDLPLLKETEARLPPVLNELMKIEGLGPKRVQVLYFEEVADIISQGSTRASVHLHSGIQVDLRVVASESYGAALLYFTDSKEHNIAIRKIAVQRKLKINEYGAFKGNKQIAGKTETDVYRQVGLPYIEPDLRNASFVRWIIAISIFSRILLDA